MGTPLFAQPDDDGKRSVYGRLEAASTKHPLSNSVMAHLGYLDTGFGRSLPAASL